MRALIIALCLFLAWSPTAEAKGEVTPEERYELGMRYLKRGYYTKALEQFNRIRNYHRDDPISLKAELAIADVYFKKGDYEQARLQYEDFARLHRNHPDLDYVVWRDGQCLFKRAPRFAGRDQAPTRHAVNVWTGFDTRFPESEYRDEVAELLGRSRERLARKELSIAHFYARKDAWLAVWRRSETLLVRYPSSALAPKAMYLASRAHHEWGQSTEASALRERLASEHPGSRYLRRLDAVLATEPGQPPIEETFPRPYRVPSSGGVNPSTGAPY